ncbi:MAG: phage portal protein [Microbacteriaceae bacterium]|nr:phage portal protein [Microbacteriaceae bacterium]
MSVVSRLRGLSDRLNEYALKAGVISMGGTGSYDQGIGFLGRHGWQESSSTGIVVNDDRANTVAAWWMGVQVISRDLAASPLITYRRNGRNNDKAEDLDLYWMLRYQFNPEMTSYVARQTMQGHLLTWGNAYAEKELDRGGRTIALWPLRPDRMEPKWEGGKRVYYYTVKSGTTPIRLTSDRVLHIPGLGFDGLVGYSVLRMARETLGSMLALREYGNRVIARDARPSTAITRPADKPPLSDKALARLRESWEASYGGFTNAGRTAILEEGMDFKVFGFPPEDIQFLETQKWGVTEVSRWQTITPHKINDLEHATFSNVEELNIDHAGGVMKGWYTVWEQQINKDVIADRNIFCEHNMDAILRGKTLERAQANTLKVNAGAMTPNEWRAQDNQNPVEWGDERVSTPNNTAPQPSPAIPEVPA